MEVPGLEPIAARAADISFSGICLISQTPVTPGTSATFLVRLVLEGAHSDALPLLGTVVWCTSVRDGHQIGARFDSDMEEERWKKLDVLIRFLTGELEVDPTGAPG